MIDEVAMMAIDEIDVFPDLRDYFSVYIAAEGTADAAPPIEPTSYDIHLFFVPNIDKFYVMREGETTKPLAASLDSINPVYESKKGVITAVSKLIAVQALKRDLDKLITQIINANDFVNPVTLLKPFSTTIHTTIIDVCESPRYLLFKVVPKKRKRKKITREIEINYFWEIVSHCINNSPDKIYVFKLNLER